jgi:hypothetical protein
LLSLDDDSEFFVDFDIFQNFKESNANYGYFRFDFDLDYVSENYNKYLIRYVQEYNLQEKHFMDNQFFDELKLIKQSPIFYNNFELVKLSYFLSNEVPIFTLFIPNCLTIPPPQAKNFLFPWGGGSNILWIINFLIN